ncbi:MULTISPECIES: hypothetical protein [Bacillus]|uniref:hypothetical protein n=1 Tax=Bacillus TaxID=1386 RepID=UPI000377C8A6|nr:MULTISPECIES: hypothetical protein [Bacillus]AIK36403.1 hypothetical protein DJ92_5189 [Bacillus pseudomycoides]AJI15869.1 hypothetical protein BG07_5119 [Bacillus pseudomycoides]MCX2824912.1 hypothetical protein [Bacillus sp. DHT2]MDR4915353.1 hypothetical protein [Bacillus pseudomycoides]MEB3053078.1 hypothetical protein [Bacillus pseudomycoides]
MKDPWNPTTQEIIEWAYTEHAVFPEQDWDLSICDNAAEIILSIASDTNCPNQTFFLHCLYLLVGDAIRTRGNTYNIESLQNILQSATNSTNSDIFKWVERSRTLLAKPETFCYDLWCDGGFVYKIDKANEKRRTHLS